MPRGQRWIMTNVLEMSAVKLSPPMAVLVIIESYDLAFHRRVQTDARIIISNILNLLVALTACG